MKQGPHIGAARLDHLDGRAIGLMVLCCALWGLQQVAVKAILPNTPPLFQAGMRSLGAAALVWIWSRAHRIPLFYHDGTLAAGLGAGTLFAAEFICIYLGLPHTRASRLVVFLYLAPFVVAMALPYFVPSERLGRIQTAGLVCAFGALAFAFQEGLTLPTAGQILGDSLAILGAVFWGFTTLLVRATRLAFVTPEKTLFYQLSVSAVLLCATSLATGEQWSIHLPMLSWISLIFQTVIVAFASYLAWFWLLRHYSATKVSAFSFMTPMFGMAFGALLLRETLSARLVVAFIFVAVGIYVVNRPHSPAASSAQM